MPNIVEWPALFTLNTNSSFFFVELKYFPANCLQKFQLNPNPIKELNESNEVLEKKSFLKRREVASKQINHVQTFANAN